MRILVVEDDALVALVLTDALETEGHEVVGPASTLTQAVALCERGLPDLALLDINLRDGSNGVKLARILRERWGIQSIFVSGQFLEARQARDLALGYIGKPYETRTVLRSVEIAGAMMAGQAPRNIPAGFELFA